MSSRAKAIFQASQNKDAELPNLTPRKPEALTGNWSRIAFEDAKQKLSAAQDVINSVTNTQVNMILSGQIPVVINADRVSDEVGSDRIADREDRSDSENSMSQLIENIKKRGLRQPIRVRPKDPNWRPSPENPFNTENEDFVLQSGRRRLAACKVLGIQPTAFITFPTAEQAYEEDLYERFFENVQRRNLNSAEVLYSLGVIAERNPGVYQSDLATILGVSQSMISKGKSLKENFDEISKLIDLSTATIRDIEDAQRFLREEKVAQKTVLERGEPAQTENPKVQEIQEQPKKASLPFVNRKFGAVSARLSTKQNGKTVLTILLEDSDSNEFKELLEALERCGEKNQKDD